MAQLTPQEQLMLEYVNRARLDPLAEAQRLGIDLNEGLKPGTLNGDTKSPLAVNEILADAGRAHSQFMIDHDKFAHEGIGDGTPQSRMEAAGMVFTPPYANGENIGIVGTNVTPDLTDFAIRNADNLFKSHEHRENILDDVYRELGVGLASGPFVLKAGQQPLNSVAASQEFASVGSQYFLTGVCITDDVAQNHFYDVGEGRGGIVIEVRKNLELIATATSAAAGGYSIALPGGAYEVTFKDGNAIPVVCRVDIGHANSKVDLVDMSTLLSAVPLTLVGGAANIVLLGLGIPDLGGSLEARGNDADNHLVGSRGNNVLDGGAGNDVMEGGAGDDRYELDNPGDQALETAGNGSDTIGAWFDYTLGANFENLELLRGAIHGVGNDDDNRISGNDLDNVLDGGAGNDTMWGALGNDTFVLDSARDIVRESANQGTDRVLASVGYTLAANVEELVLGANADVAATGNDLANLLRGNDGANLIDGRGGADRMEGGGGDDTYVVDVVGDTIVDAEIGGGDDLVRADVEFTLPAGVERLVLTGSRSLAGFGNDAANVLSGNSAANLLDGGAGIDRMEGGGGDDTYVVDVTGDVVVEALYGGLDTVRSSIDFTLGDAVENLVLTGLALVGVGNARPNALQGTAGADDLDGRGAADRMSGGAGDDSYHVDDARDVAFEQANGGVDSVSSTVSYVLGDNVENLALLGNAALSGTGNALANRIEGNAGANRLDGRQGIDILVGGAGNDTYFVDASDVIVETNDGGNDTVRAAFGYTLSANVENLYLDGSADVGVGSEVANLIVGNAAANALRGEGGSDRLRGADGNDRLDGGGDDDNLDGGRGNDVLDGGGGRDLLSGGAGRDTFVFDALADSAAGKGARDVILDFARGVDRIDLAAIDAVATVNDSVNDVFQFIGLHAFGHHAGELHELLINRPGRDQDATVVEGDVNGDAVADFQIELAGLIHLGAHDFIL